MFPYETFIFSIALRIECKVAQMLDPDYEFESPSDTYSVHPPMKVAVLRAVKDCLSR